MVGIQINIDEVMNLSKLTTSIMPRGRKKHLLEIVIHGRGLTIHSQREREGERVWGNSKRKGLREEHQKCVKERVSKII